jgi:hypothetical protein
VINWLKDIYRIYVFDPLAGGNGKIQMDEMAKAILLIMIICASIKEGASAEQLYPDMYWVSIFAGVCGIAAIKPAFGKKEVDAPEKPVSMPPKFKKEE